MKNIIYTLGIMFVVGTVSLGCSSTSENEGSFTMYKFKTPESEWIRNGEPIEFEGELWYPRDSVDILTDSEVTPLGVYRDVPYYLQTIDVRPYDRLYTKFGKNKFRLFETKNQNDKSKQAF
ncbi:MAG: hypothetical protein H6754_07750 [Candidatus Omnitrophica bacterium]|nr:hypothetical protein [Candidatus Omnitrophota bacterium]